MDDIGQTTVPFYIAPHPHKLWTTKTAGGHGHPPSRGRSLLHAVLAQFFHPLPIEQGPIFVVDDSPALSGDQRLLRVTRPFSRLGPLNASRIADLSGLTTGAITFVLDRLEKLGYARRVRTAKDCRVVLIEVNSEALAGSFGTYFTRMAEITVEATAQLTDEQLVLIVHFTQKLNTLAEGALQEMKNDE